MDLIVRNSKLIDRSDISDIGISNGVIISINEKIAERGDKEINANGNLVTPTFIDAHEHLDDTMINRLVRPNTSGTLQEAIEILREAKKKFTVENVKERAIKGIHMLVENGTTIIRSHANVDSYTQLASIKGLIEAKEQCKNLVGMQIVAFPQEGIIQDPNTEELLRKSMEMGVDIVGGMPANEMTVEDSKKHIDIIFDIAKEFNVGIDMHIDENCDPNSRNLQYYAAKAIKEKLSNVTASHACALSSYNDYYAAKIIELVKTANMSVIANPCTNLILQGRFDKRDVRRGITRVKELCAAGVNVACGQDGIDDPFDPLLAKCDMLQIAWIMGHVAHFSSPSEIELLFEMITKGAARALGLTRYGLSVGDNADMNILDTKDVLQAIQVQSDRLYVLKAGNVIAGTNK